MLARMQHHTSLLAREGLQQQLLLALQVRQLLRRYMTVINGSCNEFKAWESNDIIKFRNAGACGLQHLDRAVLKTGAMQYLL